MATTDAAPGWRRFLWPCAWAAGQAAAILAALFALLDGQHRDFHVPVHFSTDSLEYLMQVKGTIENGWWWFHPRLSAPGSFAELAYPSNTNVDQALVWIVHLFTRSDGLCLNAAWMLAVAIGGGVAAWALRALGVSRPTAAALGALYALSPYALYRNIEHFSLVTYLVPLPCAAALLVATDRIAPLRSRGAWPFVAGCILLGLNYTYYAFFGAFVLLAASAAALAHGWQSAGWRRGLALVALVSAVTAVNLAPSLILWQRDGYPLIIPDKTAAESETYGLKIRQLVSPVLDQTLAPLKAWNDLEARAQFPLETENATSRLGLIATVGFLGLLIVLLIPGAARWFGDAPLASRAAALTLALVLLGTVGGFGSLFSLLVTPEIRSYNRVYPFIAFFAWLAVGLALERAVRGPRLRAGAAAALLAIGVFDQGHAAAPLNRDYTAIRGEYADLSQFVTALEARVPDGAMAFQLPMTTYLNDHGDLGMRPYDEIKPYLVSSSVHWSYPAIDNAVVRWQHAVARLPPPAMAAALQSAGFAAIVIDRNGYPDRGAALVERLSGQPGAVIARSERYVAIDIRLSAKPSDPEAIRLPVWPSDFGPASAGLPICGHPAEANLDSVDGVKVAPSRPVPLRASEDLVLRGWAVDLARRDLAGDVDVVVDGAPAASFYGVDRPDIAARYATPVYRYSGFVAKLPQAPLASGPHAVALRVLDADRRCYTETTPVTIVK